MNNKHTSIKKNKFTHYYDEETHDLVIYYQDYEVATLHNVQSRHIETKVKLFIESYIKQTRNDTVTSTVLM